MNCEYNCNSCGSERACESQATQRAYDLIDRVINSQYDNQGKLRPQDNSQYIGGSINFEY